MSAKQGIHKEDWWESINMVSKSRIQIHVTAELKAYWLSSAVAELITVASVCVSVSLLATDLLDRYINILYIYIIYIWFVRLLLNLSAIVIYWSLSVYLPTQLHYHIVIMLHNIISILHYGDIQMLMYLCNSNIITLLHYNNIMWHLWFLVKAIGICKTKYDCQTRNTSGICVLCPGP